jgi:hypothetical protein
MDFETVGTWRELDEAITSVDLGRHPGHVRPTLVFRGVACADHPLVSSLSRLGGDFASVERHLLRNFRKYAHRAAPGPTTWDWLAFGKHHDLPTRLLDWSFSPLVALHFATVKRPDEDGALYVVDCAAAHDGLPDPLREALDEEGALTFTTELLARLAPDLEALDALRGEDPFALFLEPPTLDERIATQNALVSIIASPEAQMHEWLERHPGLWRAYRLPPALKAEVRARLDRDGIHERVLMPGLDGLAAWLTRYYSAPTTAARVTG